MNLREKIETFLIKESALLDDNDFETWLACFTKDCWYWVPSQIGQKDPFQTVSIIYDDRKLLETRVRRLNNGKMHAGLPNTSRIIANLYVESEEDDFVITRSKFMMAEYRFDRRRDFAGTIFHGLQKGKTGFQINWKKVELIDCQSALEGITVPF